MWVLNGVVIKQCVHFPMCVETKTHAKYKTSAKITSNKSSPPSLYPICSCQHVSLRNPRRSNAEKWGECRFCDSCALYYTRGGFVQMCARRLTDASDDGGTRCRTCGCRLLSVNPIVVCFFALAPPFGCHWYTALRHDGRRVTMFPAARDVSVHGLRFRYVVDYYFTKTAPLML